MNTLRRGCLPGAPACAAPLPGRRAYLPGCPYLAGSASIRTFRSAATSAFESSDMANTDSTSDRPGKTRTSGSDGRVCRWCAGEIHGRRRNKFCSDRCRLRASRVEKRERIERLLDDAERTLAVLRAELLPGDQERINRPGRKTANKGPTLRS